MNQRKGGNRFLLTSVSVIAIAFTSAALAAGGGEVYLKQTGSNQDAAIDQSGGTNDDVGSSSSWFTQENGSGSGGNVLVINQNTATAGSNNTVSGRQTGTSNDANLSQQGSNSSITLKQLGGNNGTTTTEDPTLPAGWADLGWSNGTQGNVIIQDATTNYSTVDLTQTSAIGATGPQGNTFSIGQGGSQNTIVAKQSGTNRLWIRQGTQLPDLWSWTYGNPFDDSETPFSLWTVNTSHINVTQNGGTASRNYAALGQGHGSGNSITLTQSGNANNADANQSGSGNVFSASQTNPGSTFHNFVGGEAGWPPSSADPLPFPAEANDDYRPITQVGLGNEYHSIQNGQSLYAFGSQLGNSNFLTNTQSGYDNILWSLQDGDGNEIYGVQSGTSQYAQVSQVNNGSITHYSQSGANQTAKVWQ